MKIKLDFEAPIEETKKMLNRLKELHGNNDGEFDEQIKELEEKIKNQRAQIYANLTPWQTVKIARHIKRPLFKEYISMIFTDFIELHGDRRFSDDPAIIGGFARINKQKVMLIGHNGGRKIDELKLCNFGMAKPDGYRKALRLMKLAENFNIPIITFINTKGAFPGQDAEERGQSEAIAKNITEMSQIAVPIISLITGEGGSGGAIGIGVGDVILMMSFSIYSVISPEGCAAILWRDASQSPAAADALKLTAPSLKKLGVIDEIIEEPIGGAHNDPVEAAASIKEALLRHLKNLNSYSTSKLIHKRFEKYTKIGQFNK